MSRFLTPLRSEKIGKNRWVLLDDLVYESDLAAATITAPKGFVTDFASVPRLPVAFMLTGDSGHEAAVIHDVLYAYHWTTRDMADAIFREALEVKGEPGWRAFLMWTGVRAFGWKPWNKDSKEQEVDAFAVFTNDPSGA